MENQGASVAVLSLQRLGDVLTGCRVTDALARRGGISRVEVVHFDAAAAAAHMLPGATAHHPLPYAQLRARARAHPLAPFAALRDRVEAMRNGTGFDIVVNLSSTRFASMLAPALLAPGGQVRGPCIDAWGGYVPGHLAIEHLNDWGVDPVLNAFAHQDLYATAASVRLAGYVGLPPNGAAAQEVGQVAPPMRLRKNGPLAVHLHGSDPAKDWRPTKSSRGWRGLISALLQRYRRPVYVLGGPHETDELNALADATGAYAAPWPLPHCAELLRQCAGLVSVDTVAIHLAAQVDCPTVVLRQGPARGLAFVPGPHALLVDPRGRTLPSVDEVAQLCGVQFFEEPIDEDAARDLSARFRIREGVADPYGFVGARAPTWLRQGRQSDQDNADAEDDAMSESWRAAWRADWSGDPLPEGVLRSLGRATHPREAARRDRATHSPTRLGEWARENWGPAGRRAA